jgi:hypothetical protein
MREDTDIFGITLTNTNLIHEEMKSRLTPGNAFCQPFFSFSSKVNK